MRKILSQIEIKGKDNMFQKIKIRFKCTLEIKYTWSIFTVSTKADHIMCYKAHPDTFKGENAFSKSSDHGTDLKFNNSKVILSDDETLRKYRLHITRTVSAS